MSEEMESIILFDDEGNESEFEVVATLDVDENTYAILLPKDEVNESMDEEVEEAYILRIEEDENGEEVLLGIESEEELNSVISAYEELVKEEAN